MLINRISNVTLRNVSPVPHVLQTHPFVTDVKPGSLNYLTTLDEYSMRRVLQNMWETRKFFGAKLELYYELEPARQMLACEVDNCLDMGINPIVLHPGYGYTSYHNLANTRFTLNDLAVAYLTLTLIKNIRIVILAVTQTRTSKMDDHERGCAMAVIHHNLKEILQHTSLFLNYEINKRHDKCADDIYRFKIKTIMADLEFDFCPDNGWVLLWGPMLELAEIASTAYHDCPKFWNS